MGDANMAAVLSRPQPAFGLCAFRKCPSTPTLRSLGDASSEDGMEVFVVLRNFQELAGGMFHRLPGPLRDGVRDCGVCHYMMVFRQRDGTLTQFDFGPAAGGDIYIPAGPFSRLLTPLNRKRSRVLRVEGKVRECKVRYSQVYFTASKEQRLRLFFNSLV